MAQGKRDEVIAAFDALAEDAPKGYSALAQFRAAEEPASGDLLRTQRLRQAPMGGNGLKITYTELSQRDKPRITYRKKNMTEAKEISMARIRLAAAGMSKDDIAWIESHGWNDADIPPLTVSNDVEAYRRRKAALNAAIASLNFTERGQSVEGKLADAIDARLADWRDQIWLTPALISAAVATAIFGIAKMSDGGLPACNSNIATIRLSDVLKTANLETTSIQDVKTLLTTKDEVACSASVTKNDGTKAEIEYLITLQDKEPKVQITRGEDKLTVIATPAQIEKIAGADSASRDDDKKHCAQAEDGDKRLAACDRLIETSGESAETRGEAYLHRGEAYFAKGDYDHAISDYNEKIALSPLKNGATFGKLGAAFAAKGDHTRAIASYSEAIRLDAKDPTMYDNRGCGYVRAGALAKAESDFKKAKKLGRESPGSECQEALKELRSKGRKRAR